MPGVGPLGENTIYHLEIGMHYCLLQWLYRQTGAGGRNLSGNKRMAEQSFDQKLDKSNVVIEGNCKARFDPNNGEDAGDKQKEGKPTLAKNDSYVHKNFKMHTILLYPIVIMTP